jgi:hypothetical protein
MIPKAFELIVGSTRLPAPKSLAASRSKHMIRRQFPNVSCRMHRENFLPIF